MKHAYVPITIALLVTAGLTLQGMPEPKTSPFKPPSPVASAPLENDLVVEVSLRF